MRGVVGSTVLAWAVASAQVQAVDPTPSLPKWKFTAAASLKETYDSNVMLQSVTPQANQASFVTTLTPSIGLAYQGGEPFGASITYTPEVNWYHAEPAEDYTLHPVALKLKGQASSVQWEIANNLSVIDGSSLGPTFTGPGGPPAAGGLAVRDRRDAVIERGKGQLTQSFGKWLWRGTVAGYLHDFHSVQKIAPGYQNYVDRSDLNGGLDLGCQITEKGRLWLGHRYGVQTQAPLFRDIDPTHYDSSYHRLLVAVEGQLTPWARASLSLGPEFRHYGGVLPAAFHDIHRTYFYSDSTLSLRLTEKDQVEFGVKAFEQPGFSGRSTYFDLTCDATYRHKFSDKWTVGLGGRAYNADFLIPAVRNDWILSAHTYVSYQIAKQLSGEVSYVHEDGESRVDNTNGREYRRHLVAIGFKHTIR